MRTLAHKMADGKSSSAGAGVGVYVEEEEEGGKVSGKPCEGSRRELVNCLKESDCIKVGSKSVVDMSDFSAP